MKKQSQSGQLKCNFLLILMVWDVLEGGFSSIATVPAHLGGFGQPQEGSLSQKETAPTLLCFCVLELGGE